jgi:hypothetical protein
MQPSSASIEEFLATVKAKTPDHQGSESHETLTSTTWKKGKKKRIATQSYLLGDS